MSAETAGGEEAQLESWLMADGSEVPSGVVTSTCESLRALLKSHGALAAIDLSDVANRKQPTPSPLGDTKSALVGTGLCTELRDGTIGMHDDTAVVVRNALHLNPQNVYEWRLTDPRVPFGGFDDPAHA